MKTVTVSASSSYPVYIGKGLLSQAGILLQRVQAPCTAAVISDSHVWPLYRQVLTDSLSRAGYQVISYVFPAGEASKSTDTYLKVLNFLAEKHVTRSDVILSLGGGVAGDLAGFAAATFLRGIAFVQIPTSLLAMVDSSVGGKTAIDLPAGKNLAGAFYQPKLVVCDLSVLETLPADIFRDGCAEVVKYAVLYDPALFDHLMQYGLSFNREQVISKCVEWKAAVVAQDEFDHGARQMLNLGHTLGHGIELCTDFRVTHGQAVAIGMVLIARAGYRTGITQAQAMQDICTIVRLFGLPSETELSVQQLVTAALSDKKRSGQLVNLIIPRQIGQCGIYPTEISRLAAFIEKGL